MSINPSLGFDYVVAEAVNCLQLDLATDYFILSFLLFHVICVFLVVVIQLVKRRRHDEPVIVQVEADRLTSDIHV